MGNSVDVLVSSPTSSSHNRIIATLSAPATPYTHMHLHESHPQFAPKASVAWTQLGRAGEFCVTVVFLKQTQNCLGCRAILQPSHEPIKRPR